MTERNHVAIITGASSGIGAALARELVRRGWKVGLIARRENLLEDLTRELGDATAAAVADVTDAAAVKAAVTALEDRLGPCDLLVANAGIAPYAPSWRMDPGVVTGAMRTNFDGVVHAVAAVLPGMLERGHGHLAATSSFAGYRGIPTMAAYSPTKAAVTTFMESLRVDLGNRGIAVTTIHPGYVETAITKGNRFPMPFLLSAPDTARTIANGLERRKAVINLPWPMTLLMRFALVVPTGIYDPVVRRMFLGRKKH